MVFRLFTWVVVATVAWTSPARAQDAGDPSWRITQVRGDVHRVDAGAQTTVFYASGRGIILVDPLNVSVARWLKQELATRFPNQPVRFVVYTHHHFERASGGWVFNDTAEHVGHESSTDARRRSAAALPPHLAGLDGNRNAVLEQSEIAGGPSETALAGYDRNEDGALTPGELYSHVQGPLRTFETRDVLSLNGRSVELIPALSPHAADMAVVYFPRERVLFTADLLPVRALPASIGRSVGSAIADVRAIERIDFDLMLTGNGDEATKADVATHRRYLEALAAGVRAGYDAGQSMWEVVNNLSLSTFSDLSEFATRRQANIAEVYSRMRPRIVSLYGATHVDWLALNPASCDRLYDACELAGASAGAAGMAGLTVRAGGFSVGGEILVRPPRTVRRRATDSFFPPSEQVVQHRENVVSALIGYDFAAGRSLISLEGGPSLVFSTTRRARFSPFDTSEPQTGSGTNPGFVVGARIAVPLASRYAMLFPVRLTRASRVGDVGATGLTAGAGVTIAVSRRGR